MQQQYSYQHPGFIIHTTERTSSGPYSHASTLLRHNNTWLWLDSERPLRSCLDNCNEYIPKGIVTCI
jgi:hypothetical protein